MVCGPNRMRSAISRTDSSQVQADGSPSFDLALRALAAAPPVPLEALAPPPAPGARLDEFELLGVIGQGGMGIVYRARDTQLHRDVAIKVLSPSWASSVPAPDVLLEREARATARLAHPRIVTIHRVGRHAGQLYLVLELLEGEPLGARLRRGQLDRIEALRIGLELCEALAHAHTHGVVHRDIKPDNVFLDSRDGVKVLDFGLSGRGADTSLDRSVGPWAGTPGYMAPEQWRGEPADKRTDVYAAGVVLGELLAASLPAGERPGRRDRSATLDRACPIRAQLGSIIERATADERHQRYPDAGTLAAALRTLLASSRRKHLPWLRGVALMVILLVATTYAARSLLGEAPLPDLSGTWQADVAGFGRARLRQIADGQYEWEHRMRSTRSSPDAFYNRGVLHARRDGQRVLLEGRLTDVPGWCCGNVGFVQLEVRSPRELRVATSTWGKRHGAYTTMHVPYGFRRLDDEPAAPRAPFVEAPWK
jgi:hypothetical protein